MILSASRLADIEPFHVMELLTRAKQPKRRGATSSIWKSASPISDAGTIVEAAQRAIAGGRMFYPASACPELRAAISQFYATRYGTDVPASRIAITAGASGALTLALACLVEPGSEWLLTDPGYPCNRHFIRAFGGIPVEIPVDATATSSLRQTSTDTGARIPGGAVRITGQSWHHDDAVGGRDRSTGRNHPQARRPIHHRRDLPRTHPTKARRRPRWPRAMTSLSSRVFKVFPDDWLAPRLDGRSRTLHARHRETRVQNLFISPSTPAQYAALAAFKPGNHRSFSNSGEPNFVGAGFSAPAALDTGLQAECSTAGRLHLCRLQCVDRRQRPFRARTLESAGVAITPGLDFGSHAPERHLRLPTTGIERLQEAADRIRRFIGIEKRRRKQRRRDKAAPLKRAGRTKRKRYAPAPHLPPITSDANRSGTARLRSG